MKTLAFLIDERNNSKELIRFAALLGKDINANVHILYVQSPLPYGSYGHVGTMDPHIHEINKEIKEEAEKDFNKYIKQIKTELSEISSVEFYFYTGIASLMLAEKVENKEYNMIMVQGNMERNFWLQDSGIMDIVRDVPCPVWVIPPDAKYHSMKKIIYATDYNKQDIAVLKRLLDLTKPMGSKILSLHISNDYEFEKKLESEGFAEILNKEINSSKVSVKMIADNDDEDAVKLLVDEAKNIKANLIVVLKENRNFFERLFKSSFTVELIKAAQLPVLVFHKKD